MSSTEDAETGTIHTVTLESLPVEVLLMICDFIDSNTLVRSLMFVNKHFYSILNDVYLWKKKVMRRYNDCSSAFMMTNSFNSEENTFDWKRFAWRSELDFNYWSTYRFRGAGKILRGAHYSEVDVVKLTQRGQLCLTGSRDRTICLWSTLNVNLIGPMVIRSNSHEGWVWDLQMYDDSHFLSGSWDSHVKLWNLQAFSANAPPLKTFISDTAVLTVACKQNFIAAGLYSPKIVAFDPRNSEKRLFELASHRRSILKLCLIDDNYLVSMSEDKTCCVWDLRVQKCVKTMMLSVGKGTVRRREIPSFPMSASYYDNILFIGDSQDHMHWLDCSNGVFDILKIVRYMRPKDPTRLRPKINSICCTNYGSIIYGGNDGALTIVTPTYPPKMLNRIEKLAPITSIDYQNGMIAVALVNSDVHLWRKY